VRLGQDVALLGAKVTIMPQQHFSVQLNGNAEVDRDRYSAYVVTAGVRWEF
jgi:hypothetical protein